MPVAASASAGGASLKAFEELDWCETELGELELRRRAVLSMGGIAVFEVKLAGEFLMSSLVCDAEIALADLALRDETAGERSLDVLVGGLGLGHTAHAALQCPGVASVTVVELLAPVLAWHHRGIVPLGAELTSDPRCHLEHGDFFARVRDSEDRHDAILVDIDHAPHSLLRPDHASFYGPEGLARLRDRLVPGGVFGLWASVAAPGFTERLAEVFDDVEEREVGFYHPLLDRDDTNVVYLARAPRA